MKLLQLGILIFFASLIAAPVHAQRDANTASARAAYSNPSSPGYKTKSKKKKKVKAQKAKKNRGGVRMRRRGFGI